MLSDTVSGSAGRLGVHAITVLIGAIVGFAVPRWAERIVSDPSRNLSIFPVYIEPRDVCNVDRSRLKSISAVLDVDFATDEQSLAFLKSLRSSVPQSTTAPFQILRSEIPTPVADRLDREEVCVTSNGAGQKDYINTTLLKIQAAAVVVDQSKTYSYLLDRKCTIAIQGLNLSFDVAVAETDIKVIGDQGGDEPTASDVVPIAISGNKTFYLQYDRRFSEGLRNSEFKKLVDLINQSRPFGMEIECRIVGPDSKLKRVRASVPFRFVGRRPDQGIAQQVALQ